MLPAAGTVGDGDGDGAVGVLRNPEAGKVRLAHMVGVVRIKVLVATLAARGTAGIWKRDGSRLV